MALPLPIKAAPAVSSMPTQRIATVLSVEDNGCQLDIDGTSWPAALSTHLLQIHPGQRVVAIDDGNDQWLVIAAWPMPSQDPLYRFDPQTGVLHIEAPRLRLNALGAIELQCGDAKLSLSVNGKAVLSGTEVLSSAIGPNRIEGASIDLN